MCCFCFQTRRCFRTRRCSHTRGHSIHCDLTTEAAPTTAPQLPSVIVLNKYVGQTRKNTPSFTRRNLFLRDKFCCQYCFKHLPAYDLTYDHVVPRSQGGPTDWNNIVTCCTPCNLRKASRTLKSIPDMKLKVQPRVPTWPELQQKARAFPPNELHPDWALYIVDYGKAQRNAVDDDEYGI